MHEACNRGNLSVVRVLVRHGADINKFGGVGEQRETPLHDAAKGGHLQVGTGINCKIIIIVFSRIIIRKENTITVHSYSSFIN